jgi:hypothetical protein
METRYGFPIIPIIGSIAGAIASGLTSKGGKQTTTPTEPYKSTDIYRDTSAMFDKYIPVGLILISIIAITGVVMKK